MGNIMTRHNKYISISDTDVQTISGNIKFNKVGNEDITFSFDLEKFITMTAAP